MEITANASQVVNVNKNIIFTELVTCGSCSILHEPGSGLVTLRGLRNGQCRARFRITFTGNVKADTSASISGATLLTLAVVKNSEAINRSTMITTVGDTTSTMNVGTEFYLDIPVGCCATISVQNNSTVAIDVQNANLIVERIA